MGKLFDVGDRCVLELMQEKDAVFGGEDSGHIAERLANVVKDTIG